MPLSYRDQQRAIAQFFKTEIRNLESASTVAVKVTAQALRRETAKQLRKFKRGPNSNGSFQKAIKLYNLPPRQALGPASYVRLGVPFIGVFEEGATVTGRPNLIILLPEGERLGFRRISKGNQWDAVWGKIAKTAHIVRVNDGAVIVYHYNGAMVPIYKFQKQVKLPKKLSFYDTAEQLANEMPDLIERLLNG